MALCNLFNNNFENILTNKISNIINNFEFTDIKLFKINHNT